jgi:hypothetical protein
VYEPSQDPRIASNRAAITVVALLTPAERAGINPAPTFRRAVLGRHPGIMRQSLSPATLPLGLRIPDPSRAYNGHSSILFRPTSPAHFMLSPR